MKDFEIELLKEEKESFATLINRIMSLTSGLITSCRFVCSINVFIRETNRLNN